MKRKKVNFEKWVNTIKAATGFWVAAADKVSWLHAPARTHTHTAQTIIYGLSRGGSNYSYIHRYDDCVCVCVYCVYVLEIWCVPPRWCVTNRHRRCTLHLYLTYIILNNNIEPLTLDDIETRGPRTTSHHNTYLCTMPGTQSTPCFDTWSHNIVYILLVLVCIAIRLLSLLFYDVTTTISKRR